MMFNDDIRQFATMKTLLLFYSTFSIVNLVTCLPSFPQIITEPHNQTVNISSSTTLTCHVVDLGDHHVTWFKTDPLTSLSSPLAVGKQLFTTDPRYSVSFYSTSSRDSFWSLEIYHVTMNDRGNYTCRIANRKASVSVTIELNVVLPMFLTPNEYHVEIGKSIEFNCTVFVVDQSILMNNPLSYLTWHHSSDSPIQSQFHDIQIQKSYLDNVLTSKLLINRTEIEHSGRWTCNFRDQQLTSKVLVEKYVRVRPRVSALVSNRMYRLCGSFYLFAFVAFLVIDRF